MSDKAYVQHLQRGGELLRADKAEEAKAELVAADRLKPGDPKILNLLGLAHFRLGQMDEALGIYSQLATTKPDDASVRLNLGLVHLKMARVDEAIRELSKARELDPGQIRTIGYLGLAHARRGEYREARDLFVKAGQHDLAAEMEQYLGPEEKTGEKGDGVPAPAPETTSGGVVMEADAIGAVVDEERAAGENGVARAGVADAVSAAMPAFHAAAVDAEERRAPLPVTTFTTERLIRPDDGDLPFELAAGGTLIVRVRGRICSRTEGVVVSGGELAYEPAGKRVRGQMTDEPFGSESRPMFFVSGQGHLVAMPRGGTFTALALHDDIVYVREDLVFAFEEKLRWENGNVPGSSGGISVVQFRGEGAVAVRTRRPPLSVKLAPERVLYVDADVLAGWIGRVIPRVVAPAAGGEASAPFVECTGEGVVLLEQPEAAEDHVEKA